MRCYYNLQKEGKQSKFCILKAKNIFKTSVLSRKSKAFMANLKSFDLVIFKFFQLVNLSNSLLSTTPQFYNPHTCFRGGLLGKLRKISKNEPRWNAVFIKILNFQKQAPEVFCKISQILVKHLLEPLFNKVAGLRPYNFIKKRPRHRCFM